MTNLFLLHAASTRLNPFKSIQIPPFFRNNRSTHQRYVVAGGGETLFTEYIRILVQWNWVHFLIATRIENVWILFKNGFNIHTLVPSCCNPSRLQLWSTLCKPPLTMTKSLKWLKLSMESFKKSASKHQRHRSTPCFHLSYPSCS